MKERPLDHFRRVVRARDPMTDTPQETRSRRVFTFFLIGISLVSCLFFASVYNEKAVVTTLGVLILALLYEGTDLITEKTTISSAIVSVCIVPLSILMMLHSSVSGMVSLLWAALIPAFVISISGLMMGGIVSLILMIFFAVAFYTPARAFIPGAFGRDVELAFPLIFFFSMAGTFAFRYQQKERMLLMAQRLRDTEVRWAKAERETQENNRRIIAAIVNAMEAKDNYTKNHSARVAAYATRLAERLGWNEAELEEIYQAGILHDIGKIGVDDNVLKKHSSLTNEEYEKIKQHPLIGESILQSMTMLPKIAVGAAGHHERYDGTGYPRGLRGKDIPLEARIIAIADAFDAMNSTRNYRRKMNPEIILSELRRGSGTQFDPDLLQIFMPIAEQVVYEEAEYDEKQEEKA